MIKFKEVLFLDFFHHLLHEEIGSRTDDGVLNREMIDLVDFLAVGMWIFTAGFRADIVDKAGVILREKRAGQTLQHLVIVFIYAKIFFLKISRRKA